MRASRSMYAAAAGLVVAAGAAGPVGAATYYVSPSGNDANNGNQTSPWRTLRKAAASLQAGDTAIFEDGEYVETSTVEVS